jgi:hypothetical protein
MCLHSCLKKISKPAGMSSPTDQLGGDKPTAQPEHSRVLAAKIAPSGPVRTAGHNAADVGSVDRAREEGADGEPTHADANTASVVESLQQRKCARDERRRGRNKGCRRRPDSPDERGGDCG